MTKRSASTRRVFSSTARRRFVAREEAVRLLQKHARLLNQAAVVGMLTAVALFVWALPVGELGRLIQSWAAHLGPWGAVVFFAAFILFSIFSIPVWPMPFIAGAVFGTIRGTVLASASCTIAAAVCFLIARTLRGTWLRTRLEQSPRMRALERVVKASNWRIVAAVRLSHFLTFGMQNYAFGFTKINFWTFTFTTWAVTLPGTLLQVYLGDLGFTSVELAQAATADWQQLAFKIAGLIVIATAVGYLGYQGRLVYREAVAEQLEQALQTESLKKRKDVGLPWGSLVLVIVALLMIAAAVWCAVERETLRQTIEHWNARQATNRVFHEQGAA